MFKKKHIKKQYVENDTNILFSINNIFVKYGKKYILNDFSLTINKKEFFVVLGANGSGKSTLIKSLVRVNKINGGCILFDDKYINHPYKSTLFFRIKKLKFLINLYKRKNNEKKLNLYTKILETNLDLYKNWETHEHFHSKNLGLQIAYVPQLSNFPEQTTVYEFVKMGRFPHSNLLGLNFDIEKENKIIEDSLKEVGILELKNKFIDELSGGQKQKTLIAIAIAQQTKTIILDEPTNHLDIKAQLEIMQLLDKLHKQMNKNIIIIIHDISMGLKYATNVCLLKDGKIIANGKPNEVITKQKIISAFGVDSKILVNGEKISVYDFELPKFDDGCSETQIEKNN